MDTIFFILVGAITLAIISSRVSRVIEQAQRPSFLKAQYIVVEGEQVSPTDVLQLLDQHEHQFKLTRKLLKRVQRLEQAEGTAFIRNMKAYMRLADNLRQMHVYDAQEVVYYAASPDVRPHLAYEKPDGPWYSWSPQGWQVIAKDYDLQMQVNVPMLAKGIGKALANGIATVSTTSTPPDDND